MPDFSPTCRQTRPPRYEVLLRERIGAGRRLMQALVHREQDGEIPALFRAVCASEQPLLAYDRYTARDYVLVVMPAEDDALHYPGEDPSCAGCVRAAMGLTEGLPLPRHPRPGAERPQPGTGTADAATTAGATSQSAGHGGRWAA